VTITDGLDEVAAGEPVSYEIVASNIGPAVVGARLLDTLPEALLSATWTCDESGGGLCAAASGAGDIDLEVSLPLGASVRVVLDATIAVSFRGALSHTATIEPIGRSRDPLTANNLATDVDTVIEPDGWIFGDGFESGDTSNWSNTQP